MNYIVDILIAISIFIVPYILYYGIEHTIRDIRSKKLFALALEYGIYDSIWACRKKYKVVKGKYDEYILTGEDKEQFVVSELHLWECLKKRRTKYDRRYSHINSYWVIAYPNSQPAKLVVKK